MEHIFDFRGCRKFQTQKGKILWVLQDVCKVLNIPSQHHMNAYERLRPDERRYFEEKTSDGGRRVFFFIIWQTKTLWLNY